MPFHACDQQGRKQIQEKRHPHLTDREGALAAWPDGSAPASPLAIGPQGPDDLVRCAGPIFPHLRSKAEPFAPLDTEGGRAQPPGRDLEGLEPLEQRKAHLRLFEAGKGRRQDELDPARGRKGLSIEGGEPGVGHFVGARIDLVEDLVAGKEPEAFDEAGNPSGSASYVNDYEEMWSLLCPGVLPGPSPLPGASELQTRLASKITAFGGTVPSCGASCTLELDVSYVVGTLNLNFTVGTSESATWANYLILTSPSVQVIPLWTVSLPVIDPPVDFPLSFPFPSVGTVGIWTGLFTAEATEAVDLEWVDTGW